MATAPVNTLGVVQVTGVPYAPVAALPVVVITGNVPPLAPAAAQRVVVVASGSMPVAPVDAQPVMMMASDTPQNPAMPIPVVIVG